MRCPYYRVLALLSGAHPEAETKERDQDETIQRGLEMRARRLAREASAGGGVSG